MPPAFRNCLPRRVDPPPLRSCPSRPARRLGESEVYPPQQDCSLTQAIQRTPPLARPRTRLTIPTVTGIRTPSRWRDDQHPFRSQPSVDLERAPADAPSDAPFDSNVRGAPSAPGPLLASAPCNAGLKPRRKRHNRNAKVALKPNDCSAPLARENARPFFADRLSGRMSGRV
jgi:hypothetical protein